jgi:virginiamycin B lyase
MKRLYPFFLLLACLLTACGSAYTPSSDVSRTINISAQVVTGKFQEYPLPQHNSGLMRPVLDAQGRVWFGEMSRNYLGSLDPQTGKFWQETPPNGKSGIMGMVVAPDNTLWFAEQYANYIGHYIPQTGQYQTYQLPTIAQPNPSDTTKNESLPSAPNDIALDKHGYLWFTELNTNAIASLNTADGSIRQYPLPTDQSIQSLNPYGITVDPQGTVWFTGAGTHQLGQLNPLNGQVNYFTPPPDITSSLMEVISDTHGQIWATTFTSGQLLSFNPTNQHFTIYSVPTINGTDPGALYGLALASNGDIWLAVTAENILARFDIKAQHFIYYPIPTQGSLPIGLVEGKNQQIWFTESSVDKIGMLQT